MVKNKNIFEKIAGYWNFHKQPSWINNGNSQLPVMYFCADAILINEGKTSPPSALRCQF